MIVVVGLSHKTAPVDVRERFAVSADALPAVLARLRSRPEVSGAMFLSTCNRVEIFAHVDDPERGAAGVREVLREHGQVGTAADMTAYVYEQTGEAAIRHIFRVAASLDSMVVGEPQILGQVKDAYDAAQAAGTLGPLLGRCVHRAFTVAKRVRTETAIGTGTVSISSVAVDLAKKIFGNLEDHIVLLVGAGEMAEAAAKSLGKTARSIRVCNRSLERAAELAKGFGGTAAPLDRLEEELLFADVVVTSTASPTFVVTRQLAKRAMRARRGRTLFFIDIAVPRNVDPEIHGLENVYVFNVDDLERQVAEGLKARQDEVTVAEKIVQEELAQFEAWRRGLRIQPTLVSLRARTKAVLTSELERTLGSRLKHLAEGDRAALVQMVDSSINKLLHAPTTRLRESAKGDQAADYARALQYLFDLPETDKADETTRSEAPDAVASPEDERLH